MRFPVFTSLLLCAVAPAAAQDMPSAFNKCLPCHAIGEGAAHKVGPQLNGVVGRPVASQEGYSYSRSMQDAQADGLEWTRETLTLYLKRPRHFLPGTSMSFAGMTQRAEIDEIIDYLASFDANGAPATP
jgi:cytochrome c